MNVTGPYWWQVTIGLGDVLCRQETSHYLSQCWPISLPPQWVKKIVWKCLRLCMLYMVSPNLRDPLIFFRYAHFLIDSYVFFSNKLHYRKHKQGFNQRVFWDKIIFNGQNPYHLIRRYWWMKDTAAQNHIWQISIWLKVTSNSPEIELRGKSIGVITSQSAWSVWLLLTNLSRAQMYKLIQSVKIVFKWLCEFRENRPIADSFCDVIDGVICRHGDITCRLWSEQTQPWHNTHLIQIEWYNVKHYVNNSIILQFVIFDLWKFVR